MKTIPPLLLADLKADCTTLAWCWTIEMANGVIIRGTEHDRDIEIPASGDSPGDKYAGVYQALANVTMSDLSSNTDLSVDNMEVSGAFPDKTDDSPQYATVIDVTAADIEDGLLDQAPVTVICLNWAAPDHGYFIPGGGTLGQISRTTDGNYTTEVRGITQQLQQIIIRTLSETCDAQFGDARCKFAVPQVTGTVTVSTGDRQQFEVALDLPSPPGTQFYVAGKLQFTSGANTGLVRVVKLDPLKNGGIIEFWEPFPNAVADDDAFVLSGGCDLTRPTCRDIWDNMPNFRGRGLFVPGVLALTAGPTTVDELGTS